MAQWIGIVFTALALLYSVWRQSVADAAREARMSERMDFMKNDIMSLQNESQTPAERNALAQVVHTELEAHAKEDFQKFKALDDRMSTMAGNLDRKLDFIIQCVTKRT